MFFVLFHLTRMNKQATFLLNDNDSQFFISCAYAKRFDSLFFRIFVPVFFSLGEYLGFIIVTALNS